MTATPSRRGQTAKSSAAFRTISEVSQELDVPQHVLRFWETKFNQIKPLKRGGGRRYYRPEDLALLRRIRDLLYTDGYTIRGVQRLLRQNGVKAVLSGQARESDEARAEAAAVQETSSASGAGDAVAEPPRPMKLDGATRRELEAILAELTDLRKLLP